MHSIVRRAGFLVSLATTVSAVFPSYAQEHADADLTGEVVLLHVGAPVVGSGDLSSDCSESGSYFSCSSGENVSYDDKSSFGAGVDVLGTVGTHLRFGAGLLFNFGTKVILPGRVFLGKRDALADGSRATSGAARELHPTTTPPARDHPNLRSTSTR